MQVSVCDQYRQRISIIVLHILFMGTFHLTYFVNVVYCRALVLVRMHQGIVELYDSLGNVNANEVFLSIQRWLNDEQRDKGINLGIDRWYLKEVTDTHVQV